MVRPRRKVVKDREDEGVWNGRLILIWVLVGELLEDKGDFHASTAWLRGLTGISVLNCLEFRRLSIP